jgi:hypothetical protein
MNTLNLPTLIAFAAGAVLIYSAVTNRNPVEVVKSALQGKLAPVKTAGDGDSSSGGGSW